MRKLYMLLITALIVSVIACEDDSKFSITPSLGFITSSGSVIESSTTGISIGFYTNVEITETVTVKVQINNVDDLTYGEDYETDPEPVDNVITVTLEPGEDLAFVLKPKAGEEEVRNVKFQIIEVSGNNLKLGQSATLLYTLSITQFEAVNLFYDFNDCTTDYATPSGFIEVFESDSRTDRGWGCRSSGRSGSRAPRASAYVGSTATGFDKAWMIREQPISVTPGLSVTIDFWTYSQYSGPGKVSVKWSSNYSGSGDPLAATWTTLSSLDSQFPAANSLTWTQVTGTFIDISGDNVYIAFVWTEGTAASSTAYDIDDLTITVE